MFDVDCQVSYSPCTRACEAAPLRSFRVLVSPLGGGAACAPASDCALGEGLCGAVDCIGSWSECSKACEMGEDRTFVATVSPVYGGAACPLSGPNCRNGEGGCVRPGDWEDAPRTEADGSTSTTIVAAIFPTVVEAGAGVQVSFTGTVEEGDRVQWATDCKDGGE